MNARQGFLLVRKDLRRRLRSPLSTILVLVFPLVLASILAMAFGAGETRAPKVRLLIDDQDGKLVGSLVAQAFARPEAAQYFEVEKAGPDALERLEKGEFSALLRLPEGLTDALLEGRAAELVLVRNPAQSILPEVAEQITQVLADGLSAASYSLRGPLNELRPLLGAGQGPSDQSVASVSVTVNQWIARSGKYVFPPAITLKPVQLEKPGAKPAGGSGGISVFLIVLPGLAVFSLFTLGDMVMRDLLGEGTRGTLRRVLAGPVTPGTVVAAKAATAAVVAVAGLLILAAIAGLVARRGVNFAGFALLSLALIAAVTGLASTIYGLARNERQGSTIGNVVYMVLAFSGGSFLPLDSLPPAMRAVSPLSLFYWGTQGYKALLVDGGGLRDVLLHTGILAGSGLALLAVGGALLRRRVLRGVV
ncbi:MAG: linearmycin/streptolysin transport system permease protein [Acidobacteriota bacterium]|nr:linearmycin/streptolysin transport system permease protein [Acidobacteriota bacterium]